MSVTLKLVMQTPMDAENLHVTHYGGTHFCRGFKRCIGARLLDPEKFLLLFVEAEKV